jgi:hypothetical protein
MAISLLAGHALGAGGGFAVDDAEVGNPGSCKVETWASFSGTRDFAGNAAPACVVDFITAVELGTQFQTLRSESGWSTSLAPKAKVNIIPLGEAAAGVGLAGGAVFERSGRNTGAFLNVPVTFALSEQFKLNLNGGWLHDREAQLHWLLWGAGFKWNFTASLTLIGEVYGQAGHKDPAQPSIDGPRTQLGLRYTPVESVDVDLIYWRNITGVPANWLTVGLNVRFNVTGPPQPAPEKNPRIIRK